MMLSTRFDRLRVQAILEISLISKRLSSAVLEERPDLTPS